MKKLLVLMLVLGLVSAAQATVIDLVKVNLGTSGGRMGGAGDPLQASDVIGLKIVLNYNPYPGYTSYDGYWLDGMALDLHVSGPATLDVVKTKTGAVDLKHNANFGVWTQSNPLIVGNVIANLSGGVLSGGIHSTGGVATDLVWNLLLHCDGTGPVVIDLTLAGNTRIADFTNPATGGGYPQTRFALAADLGDLVIYQIPEPMTVALLGLGGLFLRRRK